MESQATYLAFIKNLMVSKYYYVSKPACLFTSSNSFGDYKVFWNSVGQGTHNINHFYISCICFHCEPFHIYAFTVGHILSKIQGKRLRHACIENSVRKMV